MAFTIVRPIVTLHVTDNGLVLIGNRQGQGVFRVGTHSSRQHTIVGIDLEKRRIIPTINKRTLRIVGINICGTSRASGINGADVLRFGLIGALDINIYFIGIAFLARLITEIGLEDDLVTTLIFVEGLRGVGGHDYSAGVVRTAAVLPVEEELASLRGLSNAIGDLERIGVAYLCAFNLITIGILVHSPDVAFVRLALDDKAKIFGVVGSGNGKGVVVGSTVLDDSFRKLCCGERLAKGAIVHQLNRDGRGICLVAIGNVEINGSFEVAAIALRKVSVEIRARHIKRLRFPARIDVGFLVLNTGELFCPNLVRVRVLVVHVNRNITRNGATRHALDCYRMDWRLGST